jgi:glycosyltransferase involved in cell wall biosynthesis
MTSRHIVFISPMCLLDNGSGAAVSVRTWLEILAADHGCRCSAVTMALFDGNREYPFHRVAGPKAAVPENHGKLLRILRNGVGYMVYYTRSTIGANVTPEEGGRFFQAAAQFLDKEKPDTVISYGSSAYTKELQTMARKKCRQFVFYVANAGFTDPDMFDASDTVVCPSQFLADHYRNKLGLNPKVIRTVVQKGQYVADTRRISAHPSSRHLGLVTFINPDPAKGVTLFWKLAHMARVQRPDLQFLVVEGRMTFARLKDMGLDLEALPNVWCLPNQKDICTVYRRTAVLLVPSFGEEASGRVIAEARMSGIPVLAANRGGIPEQLEGHGFLFDIPQKCLDHFGTVPDDSDVQPWLDTLIRLMDDDAAYAAAAVPAKGRDLSFLPFWV